MTKKSLSTVKSKDSPCRVWKLAREWPGRIGERVRICPDLHWLNGEPYYIMASPDHPQNSRLRKLRYEQVIEYPEGEAGTIPIEAVKEPEMAKYIYYYAQNPQFATVLPPDGAILLFDGDVWRCPKCMWMTRRPKKNKQEYKCPHCKKALELISPPLNHNLHWHAYPLPSCPPLGYADLWDRVNEAIRQYVVFEEDIYYRIVTAWIFMTYVYEQFHTLPQLLFLGPPESGKTRALEVLAALAYRGVLDSDTTSAALSRLMEQYSPLTLLLDERAGVFSLDREEGGRMARLVRSAYKKGSVSTVADLRNMDRVVSRNLFAPIAMASTKMPGADVTTRTIIIPMVKAVPAVQDIEVPLHIELKRLRAELLYFGLAESNLPEANLPVVQTKLTGRLREIFMPLLRVQKRVHGDDPHMLEKFAEGQRQIQMEETSSTLEAQILKAISYIYTHSSHPPSVRIYAGELGKELREEPRVVGKTLKKMGLHTKKYHGRKCLNLKEPKTRNTLNRLLKQYGMAPLESLDMGGVAESDEA